MYAKRGSVMIHGDWTNYTEGDLLDLHRKSPADFIDEVKMDYIRPHLEIHNYILEIGAGSGRLLTRVGLNSDRKGKVIGLDYSRQAAETIHKNIHKFDLIGCAIQGNAIKLPFKSDTFDCVLSGGLLEHFTLSDVYFILKEMNRVLKPRGFLYADIVPKKRSLCRPIIKHDVGGYENNIRFSKWKNLFFDAGFDGNVFSGLVLPPDFYNRWTTERKLNWIYKHKDRIKSLDNTWISDLFGFAYFVIARKVK